MSPTSHRGTVLVVDDEPANIKLLDRLLTEDGYRVISAPDGLAALDHVENTPMDVILLDVQMPGMDGFEVCKRIKQNASTRLTPVVMITRLYHRGHRIEGINAGADDFLAKRFDPAELRARIRSLLRLKRYTDDLESAEEVILSLALTVEARDVYTDGHCHRLAAYSMALGEALQLPDEDLEALYRGGYLHDVGKVGIPDAVLHKPTRLADGEYELMKRHTTIGERLCGKLRSLKPVRPIVRHHHEKLDGSGYPDGLTGDEIPLLAQIVSIADAYDAITTTRPYRQERTPEQAFAELHADVAHGTRRQDLVDTFIDLARTGRLADRVELMPMTRES